MWWRSAKLIEKQDELIHGMRRLIDSQKQQIDELKKQIAVCKTEYVVVAPPESRAGGIELSRRIADLDTNESYRYYFDSLKRMVFDAFVSMDQVSADFRKGQLAMLHKIAEDAKKYGAMYDELTAEQAGEDAKI